MRIAMLGAKAVPSIGGIARYIEEVGSRLAKRGHEVTTYCRPHFLEGEGLYRGIRRVVTKGLRGKHLDATTHLLTSVWHALREDYDIYHIHGAAPSVVAPLLRLHSRARVVVTVHGLDWESSKWGGLASTAMSAGARLGVWGAHRITAVSQWCTDEYIRRFRCQALFIPTGIALPRPVSPQEITKLGLAPGRYIFAACRLVPEKGLHYLVEAFNRLDTDMKLVIAGSLSYRDAYAQRLQAQASDRIIFAGYVQGRLLQELHSNAYLYVQPSENEGLPIAVLEALSYGRCLVTSDIPQNCEAIGPCGYTFKNKQVDDLERQLGHLLAHPELVEAEWTKTREFVRRERNWDRTTGGFEELYQEVLKDRRGGQKAPVGQLQVRGVIGT